MTATDPGPRAADGADGKDDARGDHAAAEAAYREQVWSSLPRNFTAYLFHGLLGQTGFRLLNAPVILPHYVSTLAEPFMPGPIAVGLARGLQSLGMFLSPLVGASLIEHRRRVLPAGLLVGAAMRIQVLGIAVAGLMLSDRANLVAIWVFLFLFGIFLGMQGVIFNFLMSKIIPVERRGSLQGVRNALSAITAGAVAYLGGRYLIDTNALGNGYAATFGVAFVLTSIGLSMLLAVREPEPPGLRAATPLRDRLRELPALLRSDPSFTRYFIARALATMGRMALPFYVLYIREQMELTGTRLGQLTLAFTLAVAVSAMLWGRLADRSGFRVVFLASLMTWIAAVLVLLGAHSFVVFMGVYVGIAAGFQGFQLSAQNMVLEFGDREDLPMRIAVANSASELVGAVGLVLGGVLGALASVQVVFVLSIAFQLAAIAIVFLYVQEPRTRNADGLGS